MAPKKGKDVAREDTYWRTSIENAPLDEKNWAVKVIMIEAAGSDQDRIYLNKFETFAAEEKRFVVKNICKTETVFMVNQLGAEKKVKDENHRVFEEGNLYIKDKKDIPPDMYALIIKHLILKMKEEYLFIQRQRLDVKEGLQRESATMFDTTEVRGTVSGIPPVASAPPTTSPSPPTGNAPGSKVDEGKKFNTALRERGEEWRDKVYVDDYPTDGPNLYVAITGFVEPFLPSCLIKIGIPLTAVIQIRIDPSKTPLPPDLVRATKRGQSQTELLAGQSLKFWDILQSLRIQIEYADFLKNTAFIVFYPPYGENDALSGDPEQIYDEFCFLMYDVQDMSRQHLHYLDNMDIISIPTNPYDNHFIKQYHQLIDDLPLECITIYSVLDSILSIACKENVEDETLSSASSPEPVIAIGKMTNRNKQSECLVNEVFNRLCKTENNKKKYRITFGEEYENHKDPIVINYGDYAKYNTFHLGNINLDQIVFLSLLGLPVHKLWLTQNLAKGETEAKANFHVNVLLSCFERQDVETSELNRLLHILACRKLYNNRSSIKKSHLQTTTIFDFKKVYLKRSVLAEPLPTCPSINHSNTVLPSQASITKSIDEADSNSTSDDSDLQDSRIKFLFECPDISELISAAEIANKKPIEHMIDDFDCFEDFTGIAAFQIMCEAFNKFNCVDYKYCEVTDCFILMFFNSHDNDGISRDEWRCHICTPVCLQDFFDYILVEHYDWIKEQELFYDTEAKLKVLSVNKDYINVDVQNVCVEDTDVAMDLLMEGSLKQKELLALEEEENRELGDMSDQRTTNSTTTGVKSSKKSKSSAIVTPRAMKPSIKPGSVDSFGSVNIPAKPFLGYDLGDRRVEVFGKDASFFSNDGTKVSSNYSLIIPLNLEYIIMNITPGNSHNEFWLHKALGEFITPEIADMCESFRITAKDQVMINIKKQRYEMPIETIYTPNSQVIMPQTESHFYYKLFLTWPNGMITETVHENSSSVLSHIKQYHICETPKVNDEVMRCVSLNGEVIIFKNSDVIEVLKSDGTYIKITDYYKRVIVPDEPEEIEDASDKSKKAKDKATKTKSSKTSSKISKNTLLDEEKPKPVEYELVIDGYEIIETSGLRQQYVKDNSFDLEKLLVRTATDYCLGEIFSKRMDGTTTLLNKDGVFIASFPDKTRIISYYVIGDEEIYPEWTDEEKEILEIYGSEIEVINSKYSDSQSYSGSGASKNMEEEETKEKERTDGYVSITMIYVIEHLHFSTITIDKFNETVSIESPNNTKVVHKNNNYNFTLDNSTTASFDGENLNISYEACPECRAFTTCKVKVKNVAPGSVESVDSGWVKLKDSFCKQILVDDEGGIVTIDNLCMDELVIDDNQSCQQLASEQPVLSEQPIMTDFEAEVFPKPAENESDKAVDTKSVTSVTSHGKCRQMYLARTIRFFVLNRELTCSELIHRALLDKYQRACRWQPWCSINKYDTFGDHRNMISILTPIHVTETEKWLMDSKLADKPTHLTYQDLKEDSGKGFYHWMRPYKRFEPKPMKPENVLPPRLPRAFILRTLEQQWNEMKREELKGAKELVAAIIKYRAIIESDSETLLNIPIIDPRSETERRIDTYIQNLAQKIYQDLKKRLSDDIGSRAKATITTTPLPRPPDETYSYMEGELEEEESIEPILQEEQELLKQAEQGEPTSSNLARYWRRRAEELKEEEFFKYLLREGVIPPYFRNKEGGLWWDLHELANKAVEKAERRKTRCICAEEEAIANKQNVDDIDVSK